MEVPSKKTQSPPISDSIHGFLSQTLATLVLYNTSLEKSITFQRLSASLGNAGIRMGILVYDNSAGRQEMPRSEWWDIHYIHDASNPGVSKAYNAGFELARKMGKKWLLLLDQDTDYPVNFFEAYFNAYKNSNEKLYVSRLYDAAGMVSPLTFTLGGGKRLSEMVPGSYKLPDYKFHNCGMLISTDVFERAGGFDEQFPLDFSDFSFADRIQKFVASFAVTSVQGHHHLASTSPASLQDRLFRFKSYCNSCRTYRRKYQPGNWAIELRLFIRSIKLSAQYRSLQFIMLYLKATHD